MKTFILFYILFISINISAQSFEIDKISSDTSIQILNSSETKYYFRNDPVQYVFNSACEIRKFWDTTQSLTPVIIDEINFNDYSVVLLNYHGIDCHSRFTFDFAQNDKSRKAWVIITIYYGGCRAAGLFYSNWALIPKNSIRI